jgi:hypothetical protein
MPDFTPDADAIRVGQGLDRPLPAQPQTGPAVIPPARLPDPPSVPNPGQENLTNPPAVLPRKSPLDTLEDPQ